MAGFANGRIQAAFATRGGDRVPQGNTGGLQRIESLLVRKVGDVAADDVADEVPEAVLRMGVIPSGGEGRVARQAAKDQDTCVAGGDGREGGLADAQLASSRTSVSLPVTAAAAAIAGLTRWVRDPGP
ncbi:hypothetical protein A6F68_01013 [Tsuneonella dongtanensis]|uniref:Uncharacterized protein n=1 Tax=Tsuneonella dongtanensis TaxID=692370 RepID=A0A1B2ABM4_9SPHN|nr:hypothetical protein A6F68_01013 [Tsuneonella dongtanensis]